MSKEMMVDGNDIPLSLVRVRRPDSPSDWAEAKDPGGPAGVQGHLWAFKDAWNGHNNYLVSLNSLPASSLGKWEVLPLNNISETRRIYVRRVSGGASSGRWVRSSPAEIASLVKKLIEDPGENPTIQEAPAQCVCCLAIVVIAKEDWEVFLEG